MLPQASFAASDGSANKLIEYLVQEKINLTLAINKIKLAKPPQNQADYEKLRQENQRQLALNQASLTNLENFLNNQKKLQQDFAKQLKHLQQTPLSESAPLNSQEQIAKIKTLTEVNKKTIELILDNKELADDYQEVLQLQKQQLDLWESHAQLNDKLDKLRSQDTQLNDLLTRFYDDSIKLQQEIKNNATDVNHQAETKLLLNNIVISLTQHRIAEIDLQKKLVKAEFLLNRNPDINNLQTVIAIYQDSIAHLAETKLSLKKMLALLSNEQIYANIPSLKQQSTDLLRITNDKIKRIATQSQTLQENLAYQEQQLKKQLSVRQTFSEYQSNGWANIIQQLAAIPGLLYSYLKSLSLKLKDHYLWQDVWPTAMIWVSLAFVILFAVVLSKLLTYLTRNKESTRLSAHLYNGILSLLGRNILQLAIIIAVILALYLNQMPFSNYRLLLDLLILWLTFRSFILIARMTLLERLSDVSGRDVRLYHRIKWLLLAGGWATALMVIGHQLSLSLILQDIFNRLFMLFLLAVSLVAWNSRDVIQHILDPGLQDQKRYLRTAIRLLIILIPITLLTNALIGLIGYMNLAWTINRYQVEILLIITAYVVIRGLIADALELVSEWMIDSLHNGWLWIEVFLKPLDKILRILLILFGFYVLLNLLNCYTLVIDALWKFGAYPLINISGIHITTISIVEFCILVSFLIWLAKWTREFCYRWLYSNTADIGIRNSLSVFTQYAIILLGAFIALRILGLDFSGMAMVIGGLAVGMGFGLRDFASNIVGGLSLLIERPVREGDLVTIGGHEGRVAHIGIRSMRVSSWDNMEVLIPNAEAFNKPFTNWTHQDNIVRTVIPIKVSRADDPVIIQQLIVDVLFTIPEILDEPASQVFLKQIDDALIEFEVRYFIDVELHTRFEIQSKVLFALMAQFKAAGIKPPIQPFSIELQDNQHAKNPPTQNSK